MPSVPKHDETLLLIYRCAGCGGEYMAQTEADRVSCTLLHPPGSCCHYGETRAEMVMDAVRAELAQPKETKP